MASKKNNKNENELSKNEGTHKAPVSINSNAGEKKQFTRIALVLSLFAFLLYCNTLKNDFLLDDASAITFNSFVKSGFKGIPQLLITEYRAGFWQSDGNLYRPLPLVVFAMLWEFFPNSPMPFHLINCLVFALTAFLLFRLLCRILKQSNYILPLLITVLFIIHPIHTEVVANIKSLDELLSLLFLLVGCFAILNYIQTRHKKYLIYLLVSFFLALLSKEGSITFVVIFPLFIYFFTPPAKADYKQIGIYLAIPTVVFLLIRTIVLNSQNGIPYSLDPIGNSLVAAKDIGEKTASCFYLLGKYLVMSFFPHPLSIDYTYNQIPLVRWSNIPAIISFLSYLALGILVLKRWKLKEAWVFGILFYLITISLYSNLFYMIGTNFAERLLYIPSLGICMAFVLVLNKFLPQDKNAKPLLSSKYLVAIVFILGIAGAIKTFSRNEEWKNQLTLYNTDIKITPMSAKLNYFTGLEIINDLNKRKVPEASRGKAYELSNSYYTRAIQIYPNYADAYAWRGRNFYNMRIIDSAVFDYKKAIENNISDWNIYSNLAAILGQNNQLDSAVVYLKMALNINNGEAVIYKNLANCYHMMGNKSEAINYYKQALQYAKPSEAKLVKEVKASLVSIYLSMGDPSGAQKYQ